MNRIAFVKLSSKGKSYPMSCMRDDLIIGDKVEVLMYAGTDKEYYKSGEISSIEYKRWNCSCHVINHMCEVNLFFDEDNELVRTTDYSMEAKKKIIQWRVERETISEVDVNSE